MLGSLHTTEQVALLAQLQILLYDQLTVEASES
jgi:hypothetical protein